jgi:hypothetical protein
MTGAGFLSINGPPLADKLLFVAAEISAGLTGILEKFLRSSRGQDASRDLKNALRLQGASTLHMRVPKFLHQPLETGKFQN